MVVWSTDLLEEDEVIVRLERVVPEPLARENLLMALRIDNGQKFYSWNDGDGFSKLVSKSQGIFAIARKLGSGIVITSVLDERNVKFYNIDKQLQVIRTIFNI